MSIGESCGLVDKDGRLVGAALWLTEELALEMYRGHGSHHEPTTSEQTQRSVRAVSEQSPASVMVTRPRRLVEPKRSGPSSRSKSTP